MQPDRAKLEDLPATLTAADRKWLAVLLEDGERFVADDSQRRLAEAGLIRDVEQTGRVRLSSRGRLLAGKLAKGDTDA